MSYFDDVEDFDPPDGAYMVMIEDASAWISARDDEWAKATLKILEGEHTGRAFDHLMRLTKGTPGRRFSKEALAMYGLDFSELENFGDVQAALPSLVGTKAEVSVSHRNNFPNINVRRALTGESDVTKPSDQQSFAQAASTNNGDDGDIPF